jgi:hypothetical protein
MMTHLVAGGAKLLVIICRRRGRRLLRCRVIELRHGELLLADLLLHQRGPHPQRRRCALNKPLLGRRHPFQRECNVVREMLVGTDPSEKQGRNPGGCAWPVVSSASGEASG